MITTGKRYTPREIERYVDAVTPAEIQRVAQKYLWDKDIAVAALGRTDGLFDYTRLRAGEFCCVSSERPMLIVRRHVLHDPLSVIWDVGIFKESRANKTPCIYHSYICLCLYRCLCNGLFCIWNNLCFVFVVDARVNAPRFC